MQELLNAICTLYKLCKLYREEWPVDVDLKQTNRQTKTKIRLYTIATFASSHYETQQMCTVPSYLASNLVTVT